MFIKEQAPTKKAWNNTYVRLAKLGEPLNGAGNSREALEEIGNIKAKNFTVDSLKNPIRILHLAERSCTPLANRYARVEEKYKRQIDRAYKYRIHRPDPSVESKARLERHNIGLKALSLLPPHFEEVTDRDVVWSGICKAVARLTSAERQVLVINDFELDHGNLNALPLKAQVLVRTVNHLLALAAQTQDGQDYSKELLNRHLGDLAAQTKDWNELRGIFPSATPSPQARTAPQVAAGTAASTLTSTVTSRRPTPSGSSTESSGGLPSNPPSRVVSPRARVAEDILLSPTRIAPRSPHELSKQPKPARLTPNSKDGVGTPSATSKPKRSQNLARRSQPAFYSHEENEDVGGAPSTPVRFSQPAISALAGYGDLAKELKSQNAHAERLKNSLKSAVNTTLQLFWGNMRGKLEKVLGNDAYDSIAKVLAKLQQGIGGNTGGSQMKIAISQAIEKAKLSKSDTAAIATAVRDISPEDVENLTDLQLQTAYALVVLVNDLIAASKKEAGKRQ